MSINVGIVGLGVGWDHLLAYQSHPDCKVTALCDLNPAKRDEASNRYPDIRVTDNAELLLEDRTIDAVSIASYDSNHYEQIEKALLNGKHVFSEKPVCTEESQARSIRKLLHARPQLRFSSNLIMRKYPRFLELKKRIQNNQLGRLFYLEGDYNYGRLEKITEGWRGREEFYSVVYGGGIHLVDLFLWLTGDTVTEVVAMGNQIASAGTPFRFNDCVVTLLRFKSGLIAKMAVNFGCVFPHFHRFSAYGTDATFVNEPAGAKVYRSRDPKAVPVTVDLPYPGTQKGSLIPNFVDSIVRGTPPEISPDDIFKAMTVCFAIEKAAHQLEPVILACEEELV